MRAALRACVCECARVPAGPVDMDMLRGSPWSRDQRTACLTVFIARLHCPARQPSHPGASRRRCQRPRLTRVLECWIHASERGARRCTGRTGCPHATDPTERAPCERVRPRTRRCFYRQPLARRALGLRHPRRVSRVQKGLTETGSTPKAATRRGAPATGGALRTLSPRKRPAATRPPPTVRCYRRRLSHASPTTCTTFF